MPDNQISQALPVDEVFFETLATHILGCSSSEMSRSDLSALCVLTPSLPIATELRSALVRTAKAPLLMPRFDTFENWVLRTPLANIPEPLLASERLVLLYDALRSRKWLDESALWGIASEMATLFDELSASAIQLPDDESGFSEQLQHAYALHASTPLAFEARIVHDLWQTLRATGIPDAVTAYHLRLEELARRAESGELSQPLFILLDAAPEEVLDPAERDFLCRYGVVQPMSLFHPSPREATATPITAVLNAAWPGKDQMSSLYERAHDLAQHLPNSPLTDRLQIVSTTGREQEAQATVAQIGKWLQDGLRRIVIIAQDRLTARRVRALLEREHVLVSDETGWLLSTSRAAASVDALIETAASNAYHRDFMDLCKSPHIFSEIAESERKATVFALESIIRSQSIKAGLPRIRQALREAGGPENDDIGLSLLGRIETAMTLLRSPSTTLARWNKRLHQALEIIGMIPSLRNDTAGSTLLDLLTQRSEELVGNPCVFSFDAWREWLNRELESSSFRDKHIASPIVMTPLNAVCLRRFDAALLLGGDARQLAPAGCNDFFNQTVRHQLGLRTYEDSERELRRDLELLLGMIPRIVITWQSVQDGEINLLAPELSLLTTLHQQAWQDNLHRSPRPARAEAAADQTTAPHRTQPATPTAPPSLIPQRLSVSGYASLVACPYRFFARHVLRLGEMDEVSEELDKSGYGALVHRVLERFHTRCPVVSSVPRDEVMGILQECVQEVFSESVAENFLATGWRLRWEKRLSAYLDWQCEQETRGWRWSQAETTIRRQLPLSNGKVLELYGRIDRIDRNIDEAAGEALYDYKTQKIVTIKDRLRNDVQLPAYALMHEGASEAAYVALDDDDIVAITAGSDVHSLSEEAIAQEKRLISTFDAMFSEATLPAHGVDSICRWCEMNGLCRKDFV